MPDAAGHNEKLSRMHIKRPAIGFGKIPMPPHSIVNVLIGTGLLWVGWYGFNAGSALGADGIAATAFTTTTLAAAAGSFTWGVLEYMTKKHASILGFCSGAVGGLVVITPACGFVTPAGAVLIGVLAGIIPPVAFASLIWSASVLAFDAVAGSLWRISE